MTTNAPATASIEEVDKLLEGFKATHGEGNVVAVNTQVGWLFFRKPKKAEYDRFVSMIMDEKQKAKGLEALSLVTNIHPGRDVFVTLLNDRPGLSLTVADAIQELAGVTEKAETKK